MKKLNKKIKFKIASDGSSASGKTTGGKLISKKFNMKFLSSGSLYRFCALRIIENNNDYKLDFINELMVLFIFISLTAIIVISFFII